jgi:TolB-like protein
MVRNLFFALLTAFGSTASAADGVAVLYFDNGGGPELDALTVGLAQMLITDLQGDALVVERARLQAVLDELALGHGGVADPATAARVGRLLGAKWLVLGSYFELVGTLRVDTRLVEVETGAVRFAHGVTGDRRGFLELERQIAAALAPEVRRASGFEAPAPTTRGDGGADAAPAGSPDAAGTPAADAVAAAVAYSEGLIALDRSDVARAREAFERAVATDARLSDAQAALAAMGP